MAECDCEFCRRCRQVIEVIASRDPDKLIAMVNALMDESCDTGDELCRCQMILAGTWPSAVEILECALAKAKSVGAGGMIVPKPVCGVRQQGAADAAARPEPDKAEPTNSERQPTIETA